ncbi:laccase [Rhodocollybia butyracea]|uniref:laccase n=1 Tax=Rhodocollybia butyracea TaxID=206335 RepID=A0A9P5PQW4_9AGAR|nr:laccase [Rhodocollybia butyracea]
MRFSLASLAIHLIYVYGLDVIRNNGSLHIVNKQLSPDGFERPTVLAGVTPNSASFPGPLIIGDKGDHFNLNVINTLNQLSMNQTTSIHWHGLFQKHTNYQDGPSFVTQCPIASNHSYLYNFTVPGQAGTFWYHSHLGVQYCDGLRGALVIYDPQDPQAYLYDVDDETTVITLADWYHSLALQVLAHGGPAISNATLINGQGRYPGGPDVGLAVINVHYGKRYRFRLISTSCDPNYLFSIDDHPNLTIIEADGVSTVPVTVNQIQIYAAQRYSFVLNANQPVGNYWIRSVPNTPLAGTPPNDSFANGINSAILRYNGAPNTDPTTSPPSAFAVVASDKILHPLRNPQAPGEPFPGGAHVINMSIGFTSPSFTINNISFVSPSVPVLLQILSGTHKAQHLLPAGSVYGLPINQTIEINLIGSSTAVGSPHPFHLHGHTFSVVKAFDSEVFNFQNPVQRDTTPVVAGNTTTIRFVTDNPGPWFLHCHIDFHLAAGLAVVMAEDADDVKVNDPVPAEWKALCPIYDALKPSQL